MIFRIVKGKKNVRIKVDKETILMDKDEVIKSMYKIFKFDYKEELKC